jgi:DNA mismatch repair protein MutS
MSGSREGSLFRAVSRTVTGADAAPVRRTADGAADRSRARSAGGSMRRLPPRCRPGGARALRQALKAVPDIARALSRLALNRQVDRAISARCGPDLRLPA